MNRQEFLEARRAGLGATDLANLTGVGFHNDAAKIYRSKVDHDGGDAGSVLMEMGLATEGLNASLYEKAMDCPLAIPAPVVTRHPALEWACASLDRTKPNGEPVELKYTPFFRDDRWGESLTDQSPLGYIVQTTWQMGISVRESADVSVLSGTGEHRIYRVQLDHELLNLLVQIGGEFWSEFVVTHTEPPPNWRSKLSTQVAERAVQITANKSLILDQSHGDIAEQFLRLRQIEKDAGEEAEVLKTRLQHAMGDAAKAVAGNCRLSQWLVAEATITPKPYTRKPYTGFRVTPIKSGTKSHE